MIRVKNHSRRILCLMLAVVMLISFAAPVSASGFYDLSDLPEVGDVVSGEDDSNSQPEAPQDNGADDESSSPDPDDNGSSSSSPSSGRDRDDWEDEEDTSDSSSNDGNSSTADDAEQEPAEQETQVATSTQLEVPLGVSGFGDVFPEGFSFQASAPSTGGISLFSDTGTTIYITIDNSIQHQFPFSGGQLYPAYIFYTADGRAAYCVEPAKWNSSNGKWATGSMSFDTLSADKQNRIARVIAANTGGYSDHNSYFAAQTLIWEIAAGQSHRSGNIYKAVIVANSKLSSAYESLITKAASLTGDIPSFMSADKNNPTIHVMSDNGGQWSIGLTNSNSNVTLKASDFATKAALQFSVSGNTLTVTSSAEPDANSFVEWSGADQGSGLVFWKSNEQIKASQQESGGLPGIGYMAFDPDYFPPPPPDEEEEPKVGYLEITKYDGKTNLPLGGAIFRVECEGFVDEAFAVPYGGAVIVIPIPEGQTQVDVTVTEVSPPDKYELNSEPQTVTVTAGEQVNVAKVSFKNDKKPCELEIFKFEKGSNKPLGGAVFEISYVDPSIPVQPWEVVIPEDGYYRVTLEWEGAIKIVEKQAPSGYVIGSQDTYVATLYAGEKTTVPISNDKKGSLVVIKRDAQDPSIRLKGATFKAELINPTNPDPDPEMSVKYATSDESGCAYFYDMLPGGWRVTEEDSPQYYNKDPKVETVIIKDGSNEMLTLYFDNEPWRGLRIRKVDYTDPGKGLAGATFSLYEGTVTERGRFVNTYTTGDNGFAVVSEPLKTGINYTAFEEAAPYGYTLSEPNHLTFILHPEETEKTIIFHNKPRPKLLIRKIDQETGAPIPNTTFRIAEEGGKHTFDVTTGQDGTVLVEVTDKVSPNPEDHKFLNETWYEIWEISSAEGYLISDEIHRVELRAGETTTITASNYKAPSLTLRKVDKITGRGIPGVVLRLTYDGKDEYRDVTTGENGYVFLTEGLQPGIVWVQEIKSDSEHVLDDTRHSIELLPGGRHEYVITNSRKPSLTIIKKDAHTKVGLAGVTYRITRDGGTEYEDVTTGADGKIVLKNQNPGLVVIEEISTLPSYILDPTPSYLTLLPDGEHVLERFNVHKPSLKIVKLDKLTRQPMAFVQFEIKLKDGKVLGTYKTDDNGEILLVDIEPGRYVITELPFDGYLPITESQEIVIELGLNVVEFLNQPKNPIVIRKVNSVTGEPLSDAVFSVSRIDGTFIGEFKTGRNGYAIVSGSNVTPGHYLIREIRSSPGFILDESPKIVELRYDSVAEVEFENRPLNGIQIRKVDENGEPLPGVSFVVREKGGSVIGEFVTSSPAGLIDVPNLEPGWYQIYESKGLSTHLMDGRVVDVELKWNDHVLLEFVNTKLSGLQVIKRDEFTKEPIQGVQYKLTKLDGTLVGRYTTGPGGDFVVEGLEPSYYTLTEESTIPGYVLDPVPYTFEIKKGQKAIVIERTNKPLAGLQIRKVDSVTGLPMANVEFLVTELDGRRVGSYTTPESGIIFIPNLKEQYYIVQEVKGLPTHKPDTLPRNILVESGKLNICEYRNSPYPVFEFTKIDSETKAPLEGVRFRLLDKNSREIGIFKTNAQGKITLTGMDEGRYFWQEVEAKENYALDKTVHEISLSWGKITTLELKNTPLGTLRVKKIDKITKLPMSGVWFLLRDSKKNIIGEYKTNSAGIIELPKTLEAGKYFLEEKSTLPNYVLSKELFEVEIKAGSTTELTIENQPYRGRIQIEKLAGEANAITKHKKNSTIEGAIFEIINDKKEVVDRIESDERGIATSIDLPVGRYGIREVASAPHWLLDDKIWYAEIKLHDELLQFVVYNDPADISVVVEKRGNLEAMPGDEIRYDFYVENTSNTPLDNFYFHDLVPYDAARVTQIHTGTWSEQLTYKVMYRTNFKRNYRVLEDKLSTKTNNVLECGREALGLAANEYVTDIRYEFGTVEAGFHNVDTPYLYMTVLGTLPSGYQFTNRTTVGGELDDEWITAKDAWTTCVWKPVGPLPRTGF